MVNAVIRLGKTKLIHTTGVIAPMATSTTDRDGNRVFTIDAHCEAHPDSVFLVGPLDFCMEFKRADIVRAFKIELDIRESLMTGVERFLETALA